MKGRMNFKRGKAKAKELDLDITSLLDILVILLVFLLRSYNSSDLTLDLVPNLNLAISKTQQLGHHSIIVQVTKDREMFIDNKKMSVISPEGLVIEDFYQYLQKAKKDREALEGEGAAKAAATAGSSTTGNGKPKDDKSETINIVLDESLPFDVLKRIMHTAASAGFPKFKFIVKGNSE
jgi:biopolymer transport protein ExbD